MIGFEKAIRTHGCSSELSLGAISEDSSMCAWEFRFIGNDQANTYRQGVSGKSIDRNKLGQMTLSK